MNSQIDFGIRYGFLFRINYKNFLRIRWTSWGHFCKPMFYIRIFDKLLIDTNDR